ncbi:MAG: PspC domain-containing protein [Bacteroidales bacterium]|nr:PspC domain-containing protein [Bacteroidales bacterium]
MKKTLSINLGGQVYQIDEDAYQLLDKYLNDLKIHFRKEAGYEEIIQDIEYRMSELFGEKIRLGYQVITLEIVEATINRVGKLEDLSEEEEKEYQPEENNLKEEQTKKRLYRDPDDKVLGGVASGIAMYLGWDPVWVRLLFFALMFFWGITAAVYILLWIIVPPAKTAAQKLEMQGKRITIDSIGETVTKNFGHISDTVKDGLKSQKENSFFKDFTQIIVQIIGTLFKIAMVFLGVVITIPLFLIAFLLFFCIIGVIWGLFGGGISMLSMLPFHSSLLEFIPGTFSPTLIGFTALSAGVTLIIPIGVIIYMLIDSFRKFKPVNKIVKWTLWIVWIISLIATITFSMQWAQSFSFLMQP